MAASWTISHDFAFHFGGAERVTSQLQAAAGTENVKVLAGSLKVLQRMGLQDQYDLLSPAWVTERNYRPLAVMHVLNALKAPAVVGNLLASSYGFSHMVRCEGIKVVYCHSPLRQAWSGVDEYSKSMGKFVGPVWRFGAAPLIRGLDRYSVRSTDHFIATSKAVQRRIQQYYGRESEIIPPPVEDVFVPSQEVGSDPKGYVWAGRIVEPYKKLGMLIESFRGCPERTLTVVGDGRDRIRLEAGAPPNVKFIGQVDSPTLAGIFGRAAAVIMPSEDDFGMVATEAISTGAPVIALRAGGALDTVIHGVSGILYEEASSRGIQQGLKQFESQAWDRREVAKCGDPYRATSFRRSIKDFLANVE